jgi:ornithine cyclodeaminase
MKFFDQDQVAAALPWDALLDAIEDTLIAVGAHAPERTVHPVEVPGGSDASLLLKPGWVVGDTIAVKAVTFFPDNGALGMATVNAGVLLFDGTNGLFLGACDGNELTTRRTAAASAVAAKRLARSDAKRLLVVGTGALAPMTAQAHASVRAYESIAIWGRSAAKAEAVADSLVDAGLPATAVVDLDAAVGEADTITCVTGATTPLVKGGIVRPGTHIDLIGAFTPAMRETDDDVIRAADVWVDTRADGVLAGDLAQPIESGLFSVDQIQGDLAELIAGTCPTRTDAEQITLFKSAGTALEDVAAARLVFHDPN